MTRLADRELPDWLNPELARLVAELPVNRVLMLAKHDPSIGRGFRLKPASAPVLRQRLQTLLDRNADCAPAIIDEIRETSLSAQVLRVLSDEAIQRQFKWLTGYFGAEQWLLATLLDKRLKVRQLGDPWLGDTPPDNLPDCEQCRRKLADNLSPFWKHIGDFTNNRPATAPTAPDNTKTASAAQIQTLEVQLRKHIRVQEKLREQLATAHEAVETEKTANSTLRTKLNEARDTQNRAETQLSMLESSFSDRLSLEVSAATGKLARYWLQAPESAQQTIDTSDTGIVEQIEQALVRQAERDRHFGNRNDIKREADSLRKALLELDDALLSALKPDRELLPLRERAQQRLQQLQAQLEPQTAPANETLSRLEMAMRSADSRESLDELSGLLEKLQHYNAVDTAQVERIRAARTTRMEMIFEQTRPDNQALLPADILARRAIATSSNARVLIDGHNCLLAVSAITRRFKGPQQAAGATGRRWLAQACVNLFDSVLSARVALYFDGDERHEENVSNNVMVIYSGGTGDQRADMAIIAHLQYLAADDTSHTPFLISNDLGLCKQARNLGAHIIDGEVLADWCNLYN